MSLMNPRVTRAAEGLMELYRQERADLKALSVPQLVELEHEMEHLRLNRDYAIRVGADVVRAAAVMEREHRAGMPGAPAGKDACATS